MSNETSLERVATTPMEQDWTQDKIALIKRMICVGATDDELQLFLYTCKRTGLDPLAKQIHMVKRWNAAAKREVATIQTGIDGYRLIADRTGKLAGITDPLYGDLNPAGSPITATVSVYKLLGDGSRAEFTATARFTEYVQTKQDGSPNFTWAKMPFLMLGKCAEALALRKAFPADLSGVYTAEEMGQADNDRPTLPAALPAAIESVFTYEAPNLTCQPIDVKQGTSKGKKPTEFIAVKLNGDSEGKKMAFCWHKSLFPALLDAAGKVCEFTVEQSKGYFTIQQVNRVGETTFTLHEALQASVDQLEDEDIPF